MEGTVWPIIASISALVVVIYLAISILREPEGTQRMAEISRSIQIGAQAFLKREYSYVSFFLLVIALLFALMPYIKPETGLNFKTGIAFLSGAAASGLAGFIGMYIATRSNARTTWAASNHGVHGALNIAISGGAVMGLSVVGLSLMGLCIIFIIFREPVIVNGYAMGASLLALFARSGGGIYTKGADMGADLVGKVEAGIPEDDPRNAAVIADNVGDNVGDVAGLGADLLESYVEAIVAPMAIGITISVVGQQLQFLPLYIATAGIFASILGILYVKFFTAKNPQKALINGTYIAAILTIIASYFIVDRLGVPFNGYSKMGPFWANLAGIISGIVIGFASEYYTSGSYRPVQKLAESSQSGPAITVTGGLSIGMMSLAIPVIVMAVALVLAAKMCGLYGVAFAGLGMLATTGIIVSVDSYGPIADNAGGIAQMANLEPRVRKITDNLDAVGNTTAAIGKGFAIGSAAFAALGLLAAFMISTHLKVVDMSSPIVLAGLFVGGMMPFLFSSMLFGAVSKCAFKMIEEVRRQFREIPGLMEGKVLPDSATCVDISTRGAIKGMLLPGTMTILFPVVVGLLIGPEGLAGALTGAVVVGLMLGILNANSGGAMDNAKKYIEEGHFGGKGSEAHKAAVVGDTVGDPLKDTVGPSINILIKLMAVISLVLAPIFL